MNSKNILIDDKILELDGKPFWVKAQVRCERKAVDHRHNPCTGEGKDVFAFRAVEILFIEVSNQIFIYDDNETVSRMSTLLLDTLNAEGIE